MNASKTAFRKTRRLVWGDSSGIILGVINVHFVLKCGITTYIIIHQYFFKNTSTAYITASYSSMSWLKTFILDFILHVF